MIVSIFKDDVSAQVNTLYAKANEARERGDMKGFFNHSEKALEIVNAWIDRQQCRQRNLSDFFMSSIEQVNDRRQIEIAFGELRLAVKRVEVGMGEPKFNLRELNKHLLIKAV